MPPGESADEEQGFPYPDEFNPIKRWISIGSMVNKALLGKNEGAEMIVNGTDGLTTFAIVEVP